MKTLLLTVSTLSLLLATSGQEARAEGFGEWLEGAFKKTDQTEEEVKMKEGADDTHEFEEGPFSKNRPKEEDIRDEGADAKEGEHEIMEDHRGIDEEEDTTSEEKSDAPDDVTDKTNAEEDKKEPASVEDE